MISGFSNKKRNDHFNQYIFKAITQKSKFNGKTIPVSFFQEDILSINDEEISRFKVCIRSRKLSNMTHGSRTINGSIEWIGAFKNTM